MLTQQKDVCHCSIFPQIVFTCTHMSEDKEKPIITCNFMDEIRRHVLDTKI